MARTDAKAGLEFWGDKGPAGMMVTETKASAQGKPKFC